MAFLASPPHAILPPLIRASLETSLHYSRSPSHCPTLP